MTLRFLADANVDPAIVRGLRRREPSIDILAAQGVLADGVDDLSVLQIAAQDQRVLVSRDV